MLTVVAPMLVRHTGKKLLEKHMARSKGAAYADYVSRTSGFIPRPPRARRGSMIPKGSPVCAHWGVFVVIMERQA